MRLIVPRFPLVLLAAVFAACSADTTTGVQSGTPGDLSQVLAQFSLPSIAGVASGISGGAVANVNVPVPSGCVYSASTSSFVCGAVTANGLTTTSFYMLYDASGATQSAYDSRTTAAVRLVADISGVLPATASTGSLTIREHSDLTLSGLLGSTRIMNGTSSAQETGTLTVSGTSQPLTTSITSTMSNVVLPANAGANAYPASGTLTEDITTAITGISAHIVMQLAFTGTSKVLATLTADGFVQHCTIDLSNPAALSCS